MDPKLDNDSQVNKPEKKFLKEKTDHNLTFEGTFI